MPYRSASNVNIRWRCYTSTRDSVRSSGSFQKPRSPVRISPGSGWTFLAGTRHGHSRVLALRHRRRRPRTPRISFERKVRSPPSFFLMAGSTPGRARIAKRKAAQIKWRKEYRNFSFFNPVGYFFRLARGKSFMHPPAGIYLLIKGDKAALRYKLLAIRAVLFRG